MLLTQLSKTTRRVGLGIALGSLTYVAVAHAALVATGTPEENVSSFLAIGPGGLKIDGSGKGVTASESDGVLKVVAPLTDLKTGISLRDSHLKDAINAEKHPKATLDVKRSELKFPEDQKSAEAQATGTFTLNGVSKPVKFDYKAERKGSDYIVQGKATIDITAFNLEKPCYLGVCVDKDVKIKVKFKVREK